MLEKPLFMHVFLSNDLSWSSYMIDSGVSLILNEINCLSDFSNANCEGEFKGGNLLQTLVPLL